jgi:hypothetical protein
MNHAKMSHKSPFQNSSERERLEQNFKNKTKCYNFSVLPVCCYVVFPLKTLGSKHSHYSIINRNCTPPSFIHGTREFKTLFKNMMTISYSCTFIDRFFCFIVHNYDHITGVFRDDKKLKLFYDPYNFFFCVCRYNMYAIL